MINDSEARSAWLDEPTYSHWIVTALVYECYVLSTRHSDHGIGPIMLGSVDTEHALMKLQPLDSNRIC